MTNPTSPTPNDASSVREELTKQVINNILTGIEFSVSTLSPTKGEITIALINTLAIYLVENAKEDIDRNSFACEIGEDVVDAILHYFTNLKPEPLQ